MKIPLRSNTATFGRRMAGARSLWRANGMKDEQIGKPIIGIANSFTQFVPGHVHLHDVGQNVKKIIEGYGCFAAEFNTIAIDDGIAMGHDGMLYSLPSRDLIADSVEYMVNAHCVDALVCISNCDHPICLWTFGPTDSSYDFVDTFAEVHICELVIRCSMR